MVANRHITRIVAVLMAIAVVLCLLAVGFSGRLAEALGGTGVNMEYESRLFDTDEPITVDIQMEQSAWDEMLANAMSEEYYVCDVVINGQRISNVAVRPKGNTSLSAIAMDPDSDRYSLKLEFDHYVEGQTCWGLDKLILNNNYADATNMKEAVVYDMYQYLGADASLYNYAKVSANGEYWGVYLALEAVEESFMLRNFGTQDGELYKPDNMEMGGGKDSPSGASVPNMGGMDISGLDISDFAGMTPPSGGNGFPSGGSSGKEGSSDGGAQSGESGRPSGNGFSGGFPGGQGSFDPGSMPGGQGSFDPGQMPGGQGSFDPGNMPGGQGSFDPGQMPGGQGGGFSRSSGGADLNYSDDDPDSYASIWEGSVTKTGNADHKRVVTALKNISQGTELETYLDVDNVLKYMAVHTFAVNMDSLSGSMAHNYYLYEYGGQLNLFPWDYNLSFGGMSAGGDASAMVNDAIDTPFSGTKFFDALLADEEYLARYHAYLQQLVDEYVNGGRFDETYQRIRSQIDALVETDPTAFYSYEEYQNAAEILYETVKLRAQSIDGQLAGTIPATDAGQRQDSSALIDASHIDVKAMGQFDMGGGRQEGRSDGEAGGAQPPEGFDPGQGSGSMTPPGGENPSQGADSPSDAGKNGAAAAPSGKSGRSRPSSMPGGVGQSSATGKNLAVFGVCLAVMAAALLIVSVFKRRKHRR